MRTVIAAGRAAAALRAMGTLGALVLAAVVLVPAGAVRAGHELSEGQSIESLHRAADSGLDANTYESPAYGYRVEWDPDVWAPSEATTEDGVDTLILNSQHSRLAISGGPAYHGRPEACVDDVAKVMSDEDEVDDWAPLEDKHGEPVAGEDDERAWAAFTLTYRDGADGPAEEAVYLECRTLAESAVTLLIVHVTSQDAYADEAEAVAEVLDAIEPADDASDRDADDRNAGERERDRDEDEDDRADADAAHGTYVSPTWGYTVTWDPGVWTELLKLSGNGRDDLTLGLGGRFLPRVSVAGLAGYEGNPDACLAGLVAEYTDAPLVPAEGVDLPATVPGAVAAIYENSGIEIFHYFECRTLVPGEAVVQIELVVPTSLNSYVDTDVPDYDEVLPAFEELLAGIRLPED